MRSDGTEFPSGDRNHTDDTNWVLFGQKFDQDATGEHSRVVDWR